MRDGGSVPVAGRRLLVVSHCYPPMPSVGGNRWAAMVKYLRVLGHEVTVVTTAGFGSVSGEAGVVRTGDVLANAKVRRLLRAPSVPGTDAPGSIEDPPSRLLAGLIVPDPQLASWTPGALRMTRQLLRTRSIDCLITTSPPESTHLIGLALGRRRPPWLADFRDGWTFEPWRPEPLTRFHERLELVLERKVVTRSDAVSVVARALADDFHERFGVNAEHLPGGWDPELWPGGGDEPAPVSGSGRFTFVYTGKLWGAPGRDPSTLFEALRRLIVREPDLRTCVELIIAGPLDRDQARRLEQFALEGTVKHVGHLPRAEAIALQRRADALVLVTSRNRSNVTGKIWEYLASGRPILALAQDNEAAWLIDETRTGIAVPPDDVDAVEAALRRLIRNNLAGIYSPGNIDAYAYPRPALEAARLIERTIARRQSNVLARA